MRAVLILTIAFAGLLAACGNEIGDSCTLSADCSRRGTRICDQDSPGGYCTVLGCDHGTCPEEAVCVRFFSVASTNLVCETGDDCTADELCTLGGTCVPRSSEIRYCMKKCGNKGDCRKRYECRDEELMKLHGGEPVPPPGEELGKLKKFCAAAPL